MKSIWIATAALAATTLALTGCKNRREEPVPPPKAWTAAPAPSTPIRVKTVSTPVRHDASTGSGHHGASGISWFQGTIEEAFSTSCAQCPALSEHPVRPMSSLRH
jgi:hypothetical protein